MSHAGYEARHGGAAVAGKLGYSRRCLPGDAKSSDRAKLLTDRNAYVAFLEGELERVSASCAAVEGIGPQVEALQGRLDGLEEKVKVASRAADTARERGERASNASLECRSDVEELLRVVEGRVQRLEHGAGEARYAAEAEGSRLRNEVTSAMQELHQQVDSRLSSFQELHAALDDTAQGRAQEAQATFARLADDAMGVAEAAQRRVEELRKKTEAALDLVQVDLTAIRAELAGVTGRGAPRGASENADFPKESFIAEAADAVEQRLAGRIGSQLIQFGDVLRQVVNAVGEIRTAAKKGQGREQHPPAAGEPHADQRASPLVSGLNLGDPLAAAVSDADRRAAIDRLYEELRGLERADGPSRRKARPCACKGRCACVA